MRGFALIWHRARSHNTHGRRRRTTDSGPAWAVSISGLWPDAGARRLLERARAPSLSFWNCVCVLRICVYDVKTRLSWGSAACARLFDAVQLERCTNIIRRLDSAWLGQLRQRERYNVGLSLSLSALSWGWNYLSPSNARWVIFIPSALHWL